MDRNQSGNGDAGGCFILAAGAIIGLIFYICQLIEQNWRTLLVWSIAIVSVWIYLAAMAERRRRNRQRAHIAMLRAKEEALTTRERTGVQSAKKLDDQKLILPDTATIRCANGHRYKHSEFSFARGISSSTRLLSVTDTSVGYGLGLGAAGALTGNRSLGLGGMASKLDTETQRDIPVTESFTTYAAGCPFCHTTLFTFDDPVFADYVFCNERHDVARNFRFGPAFYCKQFSECPLCQIVRVVQRS